MFQHRERDQMNISDMDENFQQVLRKLQLEEVGLIHDVVGLGEDISLSRSLKR